MGNLNPNSEFYKYNKWVDAENHFGDSSTGPIVHPLITNYSKEIEEKYKNRSLVQNNIEKMKKFKDRDCIGRRKLISGDKYEDHYTYFTYGQVYEMSTNFAKNIHAQSSKLVFEDDYNNTHFKLIGIFAKNCTEWIVTDMGCQMDSITTVTLYATLGKPAFKYICDQSLITTICVSPDLVDMLIENKKEQNITRLQYAILFDYTTNCPSDAKEKLEKAGFEVLLFSDLIKDNKTVKYEDLQISTPDTVMTICYTSGTTGEPKGVMVIQRNMISMLEMVIPDAGVPLDETGAHMSFLPLAHIMERMVVSGFMSIAARIGFISGSIRTTLMEDMQLLKPTLLFTVPRVLQTIRAKIFDGFNKLPPLLKQMAYKALETKRENFKKYGVIHHVFWDKVVFAKVRKMFGTDLKCILCASAPMPKELADDIKVMIGVPIVEGWGMTELTGPAFASNYRDLTNNTSGGVIRTSLMKLVDIPELGYTKDTIKDGKHCPSGEICIKGPATCIGYYKNPEETNKTFDLEGYLHTGDVGMMFPHFGNGIKIVDRVKEIFKLSQGEYIIPNKLESVYNKSKYVNQILIYGNSMKNNIIGIITLDKKAASEFLGLGKEAEVNEMVKSEPLKEEIRKDLERLAGEAQFNSLEKVRYFILSPEEFTIENQMMTPNLKMVRKKIEEHFKKEINELYEAISQKS